MEIFIEYNNGESDFFTGEYQLNGGCLQITVNKIKDGWDISEDILIPLTQIKTIRIPRKIKRIND